MRKISISVGRLQLEGQLNDGKTAKAIWQALPLETNINLWGEEIYFPIPVYLEAEKNAKAEVNLGDLAYWPDGNSFCIFFGQTPASDPNQIRAASPVNLFGKLLTKDFSGLKRLSSGERIRIEKTG